MFQTILKQKWLLRAAPATVEAKEEADSGHHEIILR